MGKWFLLRYDVQSSFKIDHLVWKHLIISLELLNMSLKLSSSFKKLLIMDTPMLQMDLSILISNPIKKSLNMENLKELRMLKLKLNKPMSKDKNEIKRILLYGKLLSLLSLNGHPPGVKVAQVGILNAQQWHIQSSAIRWIFILEVLT